MACMRAEDGGGKALGADDSELRAESKAKDPNLPRDYKYKQPGGQNLGTSSVPYSGQ